MKRRDFVRATVLGTAAVALGRRPLRAAELAESAGEMPLRPYGKDGVKVSVVGFPGLVLARLNQEQTNKLVAESVERGVSYFDVAPAYGDAEVKMGPALEPFRKRVFLACKTKMRDRQKAKAEFERSLERLRTDHFDLYQLHCLQDVKRDVDAAFAEGGIMAYLLELRKAGRIRYLGFSAHTEEAAIAALERFPFDSVMLPISIASWLKAGFGPKTVAKAKERGATILAIKALCRQRWPRNDPLRRKFPIWYQPVHDRAEADLALRFILSQGVTTAFPPASAIIHRLAMDVAPGVTPITEAEAAKLVALAKTLNPLFPM